MIDTDTSHFWVGRFPKLVAESYFAEMYDENDPDRKHTPLSMFARDQGVKWYDHDFLEYGWGRASMIRKLVKGSSYSEQWADELARRVEAAGLTGINWFAFIRKSEIKKPKTVRYHLYWLHYLGTIEYRI